MDKIYQEQLRKQIKHHQHERYETKIVLSQGYSLKNFVVYKGVLRPEVMTSIWLARWLLFNNTLFIDKTVVDLGCGTGIQGIVMGLYGAKGVFFSDKSKLSFGNTKENVEKFGISEISRIFCGDLLAPIPRDTDVGLVVFNHPFFSDSTPEEVISGSMVESGKLIHRFFEEAIDRFPFTPIIMPYYHRAGSINDPAEQAPRHGYKVTEKLRLNVKTGLQRGPISIYEIR